MSFGITSKFPKTYGFEKIDKIVREELSAIGFGILTEIDVKETMKKKINVEYENYEILGACNPKFANQILQKNPEIGLLLPCNVIIYEKGPDTFVSIIHPLAMVEIIGDENIKSIAREVGDMLTSAMESINSKILSN